MNSILGRFLTDDSGQGLVEYGLLVGFVAVIAVALATLFGAQVADMFSRLEQYLIQNAAA
jgi:pilus assembly protein Flp/PilA